MSAHEVRWGNGTAEEIAKRFEGHAAKIERGNADSFAAAMLSLLRFCDRQAHLPLNREGLDAFKRTVVERLAPFTDRIAHYATCIGNDAAQARDEDEVEDLCQRRSAIQIVLDDYPRLASEISSEILAHVDTELRRVCELYPVSDPDAAPHGITASHWWWTTHESGESS